MATISAGSAGWRPVGFPQAPWYWHREQPGGWNVGDSGQLAVVTAPGSIWGDFGGSNPASNTLLYPLVVADAKATLQVEVRVPTIPSM